MDRSPELYWLPPVPEDWRARVKALAASPPSEASWEEAVALARAPLSFVQTNMLGTIVRDKFVTAPPGVTTKTERLAVLSTATADHLHESLRSRGASAWYLVERRVRGLWPL